MFNFFRNSATRFKAIVIGAGEVGYHIAHRLCLENKQVVVIDQDAEALRRLSETLDIQTICGSGCSPAVLAVAMEDGADIILAVTDSDEVNLTACLFGNAIAPKAVKLARIRHEDYIDYQWVYTREPINVSKVINPEVELVHEVDRMLTMPGAVDYKEFASGHLKMAGIIIESGPLVGLPLSQFQQVAADNDVRVAAIVREGKVIIPYGTDSIHANDTVYFIFTQKSRKTVRRITAAQSESINDILIVGGGTTGYTLALHFESQGRHVRLMEASAERCRELAGHLSSTIVLCADGTSKDVLEEENAGKMDVVIALTENEETNILIGLLTRSLGARHTICKVDKSAYFPLARAIGIDHCISPRLAAVNSILAFIRRGNVLASVSIEDDAAEMLEAEAKAETGLVGRPLKDINFPKGASLVALVRGEDIIIPGGDTVIEPGDHTLILAQRQSISAVESALMAPRTPSGS